MKLLAAFGRACVSSLIVLGGSLVYPSSGSAEGSFEPPELNILAPPDISVFAGQSLSPNDTGIPQLLSYCGKTVCFSHVNIPEIGSASLIQRVWTAIDGCGHTAVATQTITILEPLRLMGVEDLTVECGSVPSPTEVTATSGCDQPLTTTTNGWQPVLNPENGHFYYVAPASLSWPDARTAAGVVFGGTTGHLATVSNPSENAFILSLIPNDTEAVWLGGTDEGHEGVWQWIAGEPSSYTNWGAGEPSSGTLENYLAMMRISEIPGQWNDVGTGARPEYINYFIVEWDNANPAIPSVTFSETSTGDCPALITRVWSAVDGCGNSVSATQTITVLADQRPLQLVGVPEDITVKCGSVPEPATVSALGGCPISNCSQNPQDGLVLHYTFDEMASNIVKDVSGNGRDSMAIGATYAPAGARCGALRFDGIDDYTLGSDNGFPTGSSPRSVSWWFKIEQLRTNAVFMMIQYGAESYNSMSLWGVDSRPNVARTYYSTRGPDFWSQTGVQTDVWYHAVYTYGGGTDHAFYINGQLDSGALAMGVPNTVLGGIFRLGWRANEMPFKGLMDDVRIYNRKLSAGEVAELYADPVSASIPVAFTESSAGECPGLITRVWTATDGCGNFVSATQTITVLPPKEPLNLVGVPEDETVECGEVPEPAHVTTTGGCAQKDALRLYYSFDSNGPVLDGSGNTRSGTVVNATWTPSGRYGGAYRFEGTNAYIFAADTGLPAGDTPRTFAMWVSVDELQTDGGTDFLTYGTKASNQYNLLGIDWREQRGQFSFTQWGAVVQATSRVTTVSNWIHVAYVYSGSNQHRWYIDGVEQLGLQETWQGLNTLLSGTIRLGSQEVSAHKFGGMLDEVYVYGRALSVDEIQTLYTGHAFPTVSFSQSRIGECPGVITRVWTATDSCGNSISATQTITVVPHQEPLSLVGIPEDETVECGAVPEPASVSATGGCPNIINDLVLYYPFETSGPVLDASGNHRTGTVVGATWIPAGRIGGAYRFEGTNACILASDTGLPAGDSSRTISMWVSVDALQTDGGTDFLTYGTKTTNQYNLLGIDWRAQRSQFAYTQWGHVVLSTSKVTTVSNWIHIAYVYRGTNQHRWYVNGVQQLGTKETVQGLNTVLSGVLRLGAQEVSAHKFGGMLDEVRIYSRALSASEVQVLFTGQAAPAVTFSQSSTGECPGVITRVWTATDGCGNAVSSTQTITVLPPPVPLSLVGVPESITVECGVMPEPANVTATSGCDSAFTTTTNGWQPILNPENGHFYYLAPGALSWPDARTAAGVVFGGATGHLATVSNPSENAFILSLIPTNTQAVWLGGTDEEHEGVWQWLTGEPPSYTNWGVGEPSSGAAENYLAMVRISAVPGQWNDVGTGARPGYINYFIAEWDNANPTVPVVTFSQSSTGECPGVITRVWTATDACGNSAGATQTITVLKSESPPRILSMELDESGVSIKAATPGDGSEYSIQSSYDLKEWTDVSLSKSLDGRSLLKNKTPAPTNQFFRAIFSP